MANSKADSKNENSQANIVELQNEIASLNKEVSEQNKMLGLIFQALSPDISKLLNAQSKKSSEENKINDALRTNDEKSNREVNDLRKAVIALLSKNKALEKAVKNLLKENNDLKSKLSTLSKVAKTKVTSEEKSLTKVDKQNKELAETVSELLSKSRELTAKLKARNKKLQEVISDNLEKSKKIEQLKRRIKDLEKHHEKELTLTLKEKDETIVSLESELQKLKMELGKNLEELTDKLEKRNKKLQEVISDNLKKSKKIEHLKKQMQDLTTHYETELDKAITEKNEAIIEKEKELEKLKIEFDKLLNENQTLQKNLENKEDEHRKEIIKMQEKINLLSSQYNTLLTDYTRMQVNNKALQSKLKEINRRLIDERNEYLSTLEANNKEWDFERRKIISELTKESLIAKERVNVMKGIIEEQGKLLEQLMLREENEMNAAANAILDLQKNSQSRLSEMKEIVNTMQKVPEVATSKIAEEEKIFKEVKEESSE